MSGLTCRPVCAVHDALLEQGVVDAHDDAAGHLRLAALLVDDQAAVLHGHDLRAADHAGLGVHQHLGHLHAADADVGDVLRSPARRTRRRSSSPSPLAWSMPSRAQASFQAPALLAGLVDDLARLDGQVLRLGVELRGDLGEQVVAGRRGGAQRRRGLRRAGRAAAGAGRAAVLALADLDGDVRRLQAEDLGDDDGRHGALAGAEVLRRGLGRHRAVAAMMTVHSLGCGLAWPPQVCRAMPMPCLIGALAALPGGCHFFFQSDSSAAISISLV